MKYAVINIMAAEVILSLDYWTPTKSTGHRAGR